MYFIQGNASGPALINSALFGTSAGANALGPALSLGQPLTFSAPILISMGQVSPDIVTVTVAYTVAFNPSGSFFLQGSLDTSGAPIGANSPQNGPSATGWFSMPQAPVAIPSPYAGAAPSYYQSIGGVTLPLQPAVFQIANPGPGVLFLRVGWAASSNVTIPAATSDTAQVYAVAVAAAR